MPDYYLKGVFNTILSRRIISYESKEILIKECCKALSSSQSKEYYTGILAHAVLMNCFNEVYALLLLTKFRDLADSCKKLL